MGIFDNDNFERLKKYGLGNVQVTTTNKNFGGFYESGWGVEPRTFDVTFYLDELGLHRLQDALNMWLARNDSDEEETMMCDGESYNEKFLGADERVAEDDMQLCSRDDNEVIYACEPCEPSDYRYKIIHR